MKSHEELDGLVAEWATAGVGGKIALAVGIGALVISGAIIAAKVADSDETEAIEEPKAYETRWTDANRWD